MKKYLHALGFCLLLPGITQADIITFDFTGRMTVIDFAGVVVGGGTDGYTPISAQLTLDTLYSSPGTFNPDDLVGTSTLNITVNDSFFGITTPAVFHDVSLSFVDASTVNGYFLADWNSNNNMPAEIVWDVSGLTTAVLFGLQVGDTISGNEMFRDFDGDGTAESRVIDNLNSVTPYADTLTYSPFAYPDFTPQGPAPMAATTATPGLLSGPFVGIKVLLDIGSGNSMTVTSISSVPIPAAIWLFGSGLVGLIWVARRKKA